MVLVRPPARRVEDELLLRPRGGRVPREVDAERRDDDPVLRQRQVLRDPRLREPADRDDDVRAPGGALVDRATVQLVDRREELGQVEVLQVVQRLHVRDPAGGSGDDRGERVVHDVGARHGTADLAPVERRLERRAHTPERRPAARHGRHDRLSPGRPEAARGPGDDRAHVDVVASGEPLDQRTGIALGASHPPRDEGQHAQDYGQGCAHRGFRVESSPGGCGGTRHPSARRGEGLCRSPRCGTMGCPRFEALQYGEVL
jgi:hypothetical protein